jgi:limonene-1,2-epoxide hydrolase
VSERQEQVVLSLIERACAGDDDGVLSLFAPDATYRVNAWNEPLVGLDAIAKDFDRQHALWTDLRIKVLNIASDANVVFIERIDTVHMMGRDVDVHMAGVFEIDDNDRVASWRDYFDATEIESQFAG